MPASSTSCRSHGSAVIRSSSRVSVSVRLSGVDRPDRAWAHGGKRQAARVRPRRHGIGARAGMCRAIGEDALDGRRFGVGWHGQSRAGLLAGAKIRRGRGDRGFLGDGVPRFERLEHRGAQLGGRHRVLENRHGT